MGLSLGLLGSGGAILTVPILVYLVGHDEKSAIAESLAIVGAIALLGAARAFRAKSVDVRSALLLALPGILGTAVGTRVSMWIPGSVQLAMLALLMGVAAVLMFRAGAGPTKSMSPQKQNIGPPRTSVWVVLAQGVALGLVTGLVGVGGGFLIVPMLVIVRGLPMHRAVGTSLAVIAINSMSGFLQVMMLQGFDSASASSDGVSAGGTVATIVVDWHTVAVFAAIGCAGSIAGNALGGRIPAVALRRAFAVFLLLMAGFILVRSGPRIWNRPALSILQWSVREPQR